MTDRKPAQNTVQIDDDNVRVTEWRFAPGEHTGWHRHELDYVVVPMTTGTLEMIDESGSTDTAYLTSGRSYTHAAGVAHDVINANAFEFVFIEIELKRE